MYSLFNSDRLFPRQRTNENLNVLLCTIQVYRDVASCKLALARENAEKLKNENKLPFKSLLERIREPFTIQRAMNDQYHTFKQIAQSNLATYDQYQYNKSSNGLQEEYLMELNEKQYIIARLTRLDRDIQLKSQQLQTIPEIPKIENFMSQEDLDRIPKHVYMPFLYLQELNLITNQLIRSLISLHFSRMRFLYKYHCLSRIREKLKDILDIRLKYRFQKSNVKRIEKKLARSVKEFIRSHGSEYSSQIVHCILLAPHMEYGDYILQQFNGSTVLENKREVKLKLLYENLPIHSVLREERINPDLITADLLKFASSEVGKAVDRSDSKVVDSTESKRGNRRVSKIYLLYFLKFRNIVVDGDVLYQILLEWRRFEILKWIIRKGFYLQPESIILLEKYHIPEYSHNHSKDQALRAKFCQIHFPGWTIKLVLEFEVLVADFVHSVKRNLHYNVGVIKDSIDFVDKELTTMRTVTENTI
jgi:hypothetical protein